MSSPDRTVRRLRLRATTEAQVRAAVLGLEDALRCASLPDAGQRLLLVRRLDLGRLPECLASQALARLIERRVWELGGGWVHGGQDGAADADQVFFASRLEAAQIAVQRRSRGLSLAAWYWPRALPGVAVEALETDFLDALVDCLGREPSAPAILVALMADAIRHGALAWLARHAAQDTIRNLLTLTGAHRHLATAAPAYTGSGARPGSPPGASGISIDGSIRPTWLAAVLRTAHSGLPPNVAATPRLPTSITTDQASANAAMPIRSAKPEMGREVTEEPARTDILQASEGQPAQAEMLISPTPLAAASRTAEIAGEHPAVPREGAWRTSEAYPPLQQPAFDTSLPTRAGGLLFLINVLRRLGFPAWEQRHPEAPLCGAILGEALRRLRVEEDDPAWALLSSLPAPESSQPRLWQSPPLWADSRIGLALPEDLALTPSEAARRWLMACRRFLRRVAHLGLASLCLRPARLEWTATHLDATLPLAATDLRIRREGLDIDPGWLDWLGQVVSFHYADGSGP